MKITKLQNGNLVLPLRTTKNNDVEYHVLQQIGMQMSVSDSQHIRVVQDGVVVGFINITDVTDTVIAPDPDVPFTGTTSIELLAILSASFMTLPTGAAAGIAYDNTGTDLTATTVQGAITELATEWTTIEIDVLAADIITCGSIPVELLPAPGAGKYYEYEGVVEYTYGTTAFDFADMVGIVGAGSYAGAYILPSAYLGIVDKAIQFNSKSPIYIDGTRTDTIYSQAFNMNEAIVLTTWNGGDATVGDGTFKIKMKYKEVTFG